MNLETLIIHPFKEIMDMVIGFVPTFIVGFSILTLGYLFSKLVKDVVHGLFKTIRLDDIVGKLGLKEVLGNGGIKHKFSEILSLIVYYVLLLTTLLVTLKTFGLESVSPLLERVMAYIPHVINGVVILILGMYLAKFVSGLVYMVAKNTDMPVPETLSHLSRYAVLIYASLIFVEEIGLGSLLVGTTFHILFGAVCFSLALAHGLGGKDIVGKYLGEMRK